MVTGLRQQATLYYPHLCRVCDCAQTFSICPSTFICSLFLSLFLSILIKWWSMAKYEKALTRFYLFILTKNWQMEFFSCRRHPLRPTIFCSEQKKTFFSEVVVAQLVERSLPTQEVRGLNPVIGKIYMYYWKEKNKEKSCREWPKFFLKKNILIFLFYFMSLVPVWQDVEIKSRPSFSKSCPKSSLTSLT